MEKAAANISFRSGQLKNRRGVYPSINVGISSGSGNVVSLLVGPLYPWSIAAYNTLQKPHMLRVHNSQIATIQELLGDPNINRISGFVNCRFLILCTAAMDTEQSFQPHSRGSLQPSLPVIGNGWKIC